MKNLPQNHKNGLPRTDNDCAGDRGGIGSKARLLERFLRYVRIDTTAREDAGTYPSSEGQL